MTNSGAYFQFGDLRKEALKYALEYYEERSTAVDIVRRADLYFRFLTGEWQDTISEIPSQKTGSTNFSGLR